MLQQKRCLSQIARWSPKGLWAPSRDRHAVLSVNKLPWLIRELPEHLEWHFSVPSSLNTLQNCSRVV
jgi:hypothetical protein